MNRAVLSRLAARNLLRYPLKNLLALCLIVAFCCLFFATEAMAFQTRRLWGSFFSRTFLGDYGISTLKGADKDYTFPVFRQPRRFISNAVLDYLRREGVQYLPRIKQGAIVYDQAKGSFEGRLACLVGIDFAAEARHQSNIRLLEGRRIPILVDGVLVWREFAAARGWHPGTEINLWIKDTSGIAYPYNFTVEGIFDGFEGPNTEGIGFWDVYPVIFAPYERVAWATNVDQAVTTGGGPAYEELAIWDPTGRHERALRELCKAGGEEFFRGVRGFGSIYGIVEAMYFVGAFIETVILLIFIAAMINLNLMSFFDRRREFGTMAAMGAKPRWILGLFLREQLLFCAASYAAGCLAYAAACAVGANGIELGTMDILFCGRPFVPVLLPESLPKVMAIVLVTSAVSLAYPAWLAMALDPIEVMSEVSI
jgi:hypothetical protein